MPDRYAPIAIIALLLVPLAGCSKTADTAPATRLFGDPPIFQGEPFIETGPPTTVSCDFTDALNYSLPIALSTKVQVAGTVMIGGSYTQFFLKARVTDPNPPPANFTTDILSVFASFTQGKNELSLVLFDDGGALYDPSGNVNYPYGQTSQVLENCTPDSTCTTTGPCCRQWTNIPLGSNDSTAGDGLYTRGFALVNLTTNNVEATNLFKDCIAQQNHQYPFQTSPGTTITFRIDAVDHEGNLTTAPIKPSVTAGVSSFACSGDDCLCCWLQFGIAGIQDPNGRCRGLSGMYGPEWPDGFCNQVLAPI